MEHLSKESITKLRDLEKYILDVPARFNLVLWGAHVDESQRDFDACDLVQDLEYTLTEKTMNQVLEANPPCGTVACLAGNVCVMAGKVEPVKSGNDLVYYFNYNTPDVARLYLGISKEQAEKLFYPYDPDPSTDYTWPEEWQEKLDAQRPGTKEYAQVAVDRIEHFIATGE